MSLRSTALSVALALDLAFGEPPAAWHPVSVAGRALASAPTDFAHGAHARQVAGGAAVMLAASGLAVVVGGAVERGVMKGLAGTAMRGAALKPLFAIRMLLREADAIADALEDGRIDDARARLPSLVSRPTAGLPAALVAAAAIESLAENLYPTR